MKRRVVRLLVSVFLTMVVVVASLTGVNTVQAAFVETKLLPSDPSQSLNFGFSVAIDGNLAVIGTSGFGQTGAYLYDANTGQEVKKFATPSGSSTFGTSVAIHQDVALIGQSNDRAPNGRNSGSTTPFDVMPFQQLPQLFPADAFDTDRFGTSVATNGQLALVGSPYTDSDEFATGSAYVFDVATGQQLRKISSSVESAQFGNSVAIEGNIGLIGAPIEDEGTAYLYDLMTGTRLFRLKAADASGFDTFGTSVAIDGNLAIIGAPHDDAPAGDSGSAYVFDVTTGQQLMKLNASDSAAGDRFGTAVSISGNLALIGAPRVDGDAANSGAAYLFDVSTGQQLAKIVPSDLAQDDNFGRALAINGNKFVIASFWDDDAGQNAGSAYLYRLVPEPTAVVLLMIGAVGMAMVRRSR